MKTFFKTTEEKRINALAYYYEHKDAKIEYSKKYYALNKEKYTEYNRNWFMENRQRGNEIAYAYVERNRNKHNARTLAFQHFPDLQECSIDGCREIGGRHHSDYAKPLEIIWLCRKHHLEWEKHHIPKCAIIYDRTK